MDDNRVVLNKIYSALTGVFFYVEAVAVYTDRNLVTDEFERLFYFSAIALAVLFFISATVIFYNLIQDRFVNGFVAFPFLLYTGLVLELYHRGETSLAGLALHLFVSALIVAPVFYEIWKYGKILIPELVRYLSRGRYGK